MSNSASLINVISLKGKFDNATLNLSTASLKVYDRVFIRVKLLEIAMADFHYVDNVNENQLILQTDWYFLRFR